METLKELFYRCLTNHADMTMVDMNKKETAVKILIRPCTWRFLVKDSKTDKLIKKVALDEIHEIIKNRMDHHSKFLDVLTLWHGKKFIIKTVVLKGTSEGIDYWAKLLSKLINLKMPPTLCLNQFLFRKLYERVPEVEAKRPENTYFQEPLAEVLTREHKMINPAENFAFTWPIIAPDLNLTDTQKVIPHHLNYGCYKYKKKKDPLFASRSDKQLTLNVMDLRTLYFYMMKNKTTIPNNLDPNKINS
ncbi:hypothetical protein Ciccas_002619 [Cichlidogyrus casuarinus]|uniref:Uncharacterized protein n=1 Tax=Cichlidogyrus casuarinus TaxID=1844966 RepID=A0ABD2QGQ7_9PLAT